MKYVKSNYGRIVIAGLIDAALIIALFVTLSNYLELTPGMNANPNFSLFIGFILYRLLTILFFNSTLGMKALKLTFLNANEGVLNFKEKILA